MNLFARTQRIWVDRKILVTLVRRDLRVRYARSWLGYLWTLIDPLAMAMVYWFVFGVLMKRESSAGLPFIIFMLAGFLPWTWFNNSINETSRALYTERLLVRSTNIPREMWVIRVVLAKGIEFLLSLPILVLFVIVFVLRGSEVMPNWRVVFVIPAVLLMLLLCTGLGLMMAPVTALVEDFARIVRIALRMLFYLTPIVYPLTLVEERAPWAAGFMNFNPLVGITDMFRIGLTKPEDYHFLGWAWLSAGVLALLWFGFGMWVFRKLEPAVLKEI